MITALVQWTLRQPISRDKARELFSATAPKYREVPGLIRKYYIVSNDGGTIGGVYLWESRADADRLYDTQWKGSIRERFGCEPSITYFESPVIVDNAAASIQTDV